MSKTTVTKIKQQYVSRQLTTAISIAILIGMLAMFLLYASNQKREILDSNENAMSLVAQSIILNLHSIMVAGYADIARDFADGLKTIPGITEVHITRVDGSEAFLDNETIDSVNEFTGEESFYTRDTEEFSQIISPDDPILVGVLESQNMQQYYEEQNGEEFLTFLAPIKNMERCYNCHGKNHTVRGFLKVSTSLDLITKILEEKTRNTVLIFFVTSVIIIIATLSLVFESLIFPLNNLTGAMRQVANGRLHLRAPVNGNDEFTEIARNFNVMIHRIEHSYLQQQQEQNKLLAIVQTNQEGVICTDISGNIVLVNPAASKILNRKTDSLIDKPVDDLMTKFKTDSAWFDGSEESVKPRLVEYKKKNLNMVANVISDDSGTLLGRSLRFQDVTEELEIRNRLKQLSTVDSLTGLFNRRHFDQSISQEIERSVADQQQLSLLMIDIDFFKKVNDTHGHDVGDKVLVDISKIIKKAVRSNDIPCRFGGEEFIVLLPETLINNAEMLAERMRKKIENTEVGGINITVSIGVSSLNMTAANKPDELLKLADTELYRAKNSGRNLVCVTEAANV